MKSTLDESIRATLAAMVAEAPELGPIPIGPEVQLRPLLELPRRPRRMALVAAVVCVAAGSAAAAIVSQRDDANEPMPAQAPSLPASSAPVAEGSLGYLSVPTMDGGAFVIDRQQLAAGFAVHDASTALPEDSTNETAVIYVGREQFGALETLPNGAEIDWKATGSNREIVFVVTSVRQYDANVEPATIIAAGLVVVIDTASPDSSQRIVITAVQATDSTTTDTTTRS
jgi:hypothetical protein